jgi:hypothetical protein
LAGRVQGKVGSPGYIEHDLATDLWGELVEISKDALVEFECRPGLFVGVFESITESSKYLGKGIAFFVFGHILGGLGK